MAWGFKLVPAPVEDFAPSSPGAVNYRTIVPGWGSDYQDYEEVDLQAFIPQIQGLESAFVTSRRLKSRGSYHRLGREFIRMSVALDGISGSDWDALQRMVASGRGVMFTPPFDKYTLWQSNFGGKDEDGGLAQIGESADGSYTPRSTGELFPSSIGNEDGLAGLVLNGIKSTRGYLGKALLFERASDNVLTQSNPGLTAENGAVIDNALVSNATTVAGKVIYLPGAGAQAAARITTVPSLTNGEVYVASVWVRVQGNIQVHLRVVNGSNHDSVAAENKPGWQRLEVSWTQSGTSATVKVINLSGANSAHVQTGAWQIEKGYRATSFLAAAAPTSPDSLLINDSMAPGAGLTFLFWFRYQESLDFNYLASFRQDSTDCYIYHRNGTFIVRLTGAADVTASATASDGDWIQLAVVLEADAGGQVVRIFENGSEIGSQGYTGTYRVPVSDAGVYIGSDLGLGSPNNDALNEAMDSCRIDNRAWTAQEVQDNYDLISDDGLRALLAQTAGRVFLIESLPRPFRSIATDDIVGDLVLNQVDWIPGGLGA